MDYMIFNVRTHVNACDCTRKCTATITESALKVDSGRKISSCTRESNPRQRRNGPTLYQLSYIPTPLCVCLSLPLTFSFFFRLYFLSPRLLSQ